mmetsp:Transcript_35834/g.83024  ORF Transcript_35834/g.83024 Transcript_35834/m.83024 type:complete len:196 (+) Transcript_35834:1-588(+)
MRARELASAPIRSATLATRPRALEEVLAAARSLGVDGFEEPELLWLVDLALAVETPAGWIEVEISSRALAQLQQPTPVQPLESEPSQAAQQPAVPPPPAMRRRTPSTATATAPPPPPPHALEALVSGRISDGVTAAETTRMHTFYHNTLTGRSSWQHPIDENVRLEIKRWRHPTAEQSAHPGELRMSDFYQLIAF